MSTALQGAGVGRLRQMVASRSQSLSKYRDQLYGTGPILLNGGAIVGGAFLGGLVDGYMAKDKDDEGDTSVMLGTAMVVGGAFMKQPLLVYGGAGMVAHMAREQGVSMGQEWAKPRKAA